MRCTLQSILKPIVQSVNLKTGLIAWYDFDETTGTILYDKSGNGLNGTNNANVTIRSGSQDRYFYIGSGHTNVADNNLLTPSGAFTIGVVFTTPSSFAYNGFWGKANEIRISFSNSAALSFIIYHNNSTTNMIVSTSNLSASTRYHAMFTYDGSGNRSGMKIYINNVEDVATTGGGATATLVNTSNGLLIGAYNAGNGLNGLVEHVSFYGKEFNAQERTAWYNNGTKLYYINL